MWWPRKRTRVHLILPDTKVDKTMAALTTKADAKAMMEAEERYVFVSAKMMKAEVEFRKNLA